MKERGALVISIVLLTLIFLACPCLGGTKEVPWATINAGDFQNQDARSWILIGVVSAEKWMAFPAEEKAVLARVLVARECEKMGCEKARYLVVTDGENFFIFLKCTNGKET